MYFIPSENFWKHIWGWYIGASEWPTVSSFLQVYEDLMVCYLQFASGGVRGTYRRSGRPGPQWRGGAGLFHQSGLAPARVRWGRSARLLSHQRRDYGRDCALKVLIYHFVTYRRIWTSSVALSPENSLSTVNSLKSGSPISVTSDIWPGFLKE